MADAAGNGERNEGMNVVERTAARFGRIRLGVRLSLAFAAVLVLTALLGVAALVNLSRVQATAGELAEKWLPSVSHLAAARAGLLAYRELEVKDANATDDSYRSEYEDKIKAATATVEQHIGAYQKLAVGADERKLAAAFGTRWNEYLKFSQKVIELSRAGKNDDAHDISDGAANMAQDDAISAIDDLAKFNTAGGATAAERATVAYRQARAWTFGLVGAALAVGALLSLVITRSLLWQLGGEPSAAAEVARAVAQGDLTTPIRIVAGDSSSLMACLHHMQSNLTHIVAAVRQGSEQVATASREIAQGNSDLSGRTEQQASALQQTAASMGQLGSTVRHNAESAVQADQLAKSASAVARRGGEVVARVVQTMHGINDSSRRIVDIISVIDGIAFQTNILALNAAVEAARAGEQGRGFAVVASEVRSLAQRSAEAAREIKTLIAASVERVEQGSALVEEAGGTMKEVVASIGRVTDIVAEISAASREQSSGVSQVGEAVTQMDHATQQNAALVEQSAAAADGLRTQAQGLVEAVASFRLTGAAG